MRKNLIALASAVFIAVSLPLPCWAGDDGLSCPRAGAAIGGLAGSPLGRSHAQATGGLTGLTADDISRPMVYGRGTAYEPRGCPFVPIPAYASTVYVPDYAALPARPSESIYASEQHRSYCREFSQRVRTGDHVEENYGTACMQPDGTWRIAPDDEDGTTNEQ